MSDKYEKITIEKKWAPECPECRAGGLSVRKVEGKNRCGECGHRW